MDLPDSIIKHSGCSVSFLKSFGSSFTDAYPFYCYKCIPCLSKLCAEKPYLHVCYNYTFCITDFITPILTLGRHFGFHFLGCIPKSWIYDLKINEVLLYRSLSPITYNFFFFNFYLFMIVTQRERER